MIDVFLSYSHTDKDVADELCSMLDELEVAYFRDEKNIKWGLSVSSEVELALSQSLAVMVVISPGSLKSDWVPYEIGYGKALGKRILPYLTHPSIDLPGYIADLKHHVDLSLVRSFFEEQFSPDSESSLIQQSSQAELSIGARLRKAYDLMPELLEEMKNDVESDETKLLREYVILPTRGVIFNSSKPRFGLFEDEHENLLGRIDILLDYGFLVDVTPGDTPIYRMTESFMEQLRQLDLAP